MKLYDEVQNNKFSEIFELSNKKKIKKIFYMLENSKIIKLMFKKIKKIRTISIKSHDKIFKIFNSGVLKRVKFNNRSSKYNLIIICTGSDSSLVKNIFHDQFIKRSYEETSITTILSHNSLNNNTVRQFFLNNGILALLPISNKKTSIVWSIKKDMCKQSNLFIKKKIKFYTKKYLKKIKFATTIENRDLNFLIRNKYHQERILLFGDALHVVHPLVGQGFNMTLRDLSSLKKILENKINLGLDIGSSDILSQFTDEVKPRNFVYSISIDFLKNSFSIKNKLFKEFRNKIIEILNKNNFVKNLFFNIADKGLKF